MRKQSAPHDERALEIKGLHKKLRVRKKRIVVLTIVLAIVAGGLLYYFSSPDLPENSSFDFPTQPVKLSLNLPDYGEDAIKKAIALYQKKHPNVTIDLTNSNRDSYHQLLRQQLRFGKPPDIIAFKNDYIDLFSDELQTVNDSVFDKRLINSSYVPHTLTGLKDGDALKATPLTSGSLVLIYNKKILGAEGVNAPTTWDEVAAASLKLTKKSGETITQSAIALGTSNNVDRAGDILSLLMLQNGALIISADKNRALFAEPESPSYFPGTEAAKFYVAFADPRKDVYSWNKKLDRSVAEFKAGRLAMLVGTPDDVAAIHASNPPFDFATARVPQVKDGRQLTVSSYWALGVTKTSSYPLVAFDFLKFLTNRKNSLAFSDESLLPSSRADVLSSRNRRDEFRGAIDSSEISRSFYKKDPDQFEVIMRRLIERIYLGENPQKVADQEAAELTRSLDQNV